MIWVCSSCATLNAMLDRQCVVCDKDNAHHVIEDDSEILEIQFVHIFWYMKAEVENRLNNTQVMEINGFNIGR